MRGLLRGLSQEQRATGGLLGLTDSGGGARQRVQAPQEPPVGLVLPGDRAVALPAVASQRVEPAVVADPSEGVRLERPTLRVRLIREHRVALVSGSSFGLEGCCLRLSYGMLNEADLDEALERLESGLERLCSRPG
mgnify:CR=1 FL=1